MAFFNFRPKIDPNAQEGKRKPRGRQVADTVDDMRRRARHRLIGACLLVLIGIVVFPLVFDTQPRPVQVVAQVEIPGSDSAQPLFPPRPSVATAPNNAPANGLEDGEEIYHPTAAPVAAVTPPVTQTAQTSVPAPAATPGRSLAQTAAQESTASARNTAAAQQQQQQQAQQQQQQTQQQQAAAAAARAQAAAQQQAAAAAARPTPAPAPVLTPPASRATDSDRARALLEGRSVETVVTSRAEQGRFIVQVGAYTDEAKVNEIRGQLSRLGLSTYTQVVETATGRATRVRVGPFGSRDEADKAATKIKSTNLPTVIMTL